MHLQCIFWKLSVQLMNARHLIFGQNSVAPMHLVLLYKSIYIYTETIEEQPCEKVINIGIAYSLSKPVIFLCSLVTVAYSC